PVGVMVTRWERGQGRDRPGGVVIIRPAAGSAPPGPCRRRLGAGPPADPDRSRLSRVGRATGAGGEPLDGRVTGAGGEPLYGRVTRGGSEPFDRRCGAGWCRAGRVRRRCRRLRRAIPAGGEPGRVSLGRGSRPGSEEWRGGCRGWI